MMHMIPSVKVLETKAGWLEKSELYKIEEMFVACEEILSAADSRP